jgi:hypothetical protein
MQDYTVTTNSIDVRAIEQALQTLNYRLTARALNLWQGDESGFSHGSLYDDLCDILNPITISRVRRAAIPTKERERIFHALLGHYLQYSLFPDENELFTWMKGAAAHVDGEKIYFKDILSWCQKLCSVLQGQEARRLRCLCHQAPGVIGTDTALVL